MKTLLKIIGILIIVIVALLVIIPMVFKAEIIEITKKEINKNVNAKVEFAKMDLNLFSSFPDFNLSIDRLSISGKGEFDNDTLATIEEVSVSVDLLSVFSGNSYTIKKIKLINPKVYVKILENGKANYEITIEEQDVNKGSDTKNTEQSAFNLSINRFHIENGYLFYNDLESEIIMSAAGINHTLYGNLSSDNVVLRANSKISKLNLSYGGINYLNNVAIASKANIDADLKNEIYKLGRNDLIINGLIIEFDGSVSYINDDLNLLLTFKSVENDFQQILSLIPAIYTKDYENIISEGTFSIDGLISGAYTENALPAFSINASIMEGKFQYPTLPKSVSNINMVSNISNKGGDADNTIINISRFDLKLGDNPISARLKISSPVSDPEIDTKFTGTFNLSELSQYYPLSEEEQLSGMIIADLSFKGNLSSIEQEKYDEFLAMGSIVANNVKYSTPEISTDVLIEKAQLNFSPAYIDLVSFKARADSSDLNATGKITNYISYYLRDDVLAGYFSANSKYLNIDQLLSVKQEDEQINVNSNQDDFNGENTSETEPLEIPSNINFSVDCKFKKLVYDNLDMEQVVGSIEIKNSSLIINELSMKAVGGEMGLTGSFSTADANNPVASINFDIQNISIPESYNNFAIFRKYLPLTQKTTGLMSATFSLNTVLDSKLIPEYETMHGNGSLSTKSVSINGINTMVKLADELKISALKNVSINDFIAQFKVDSGKLVVSPTNFKSGAISGEISGWTGLDQKIGYNLHLNIPKSQLGGAANDVIDNMLNQINGLGTNFSMPNNIPVDIIIGGTLLDPKIETKLSNNVMDLKNVDAKEIIKNEIGEDALEQTQKLIDEADIQAQNIIDEATKQAELIRLKASEAVKLLNTETDNQAKAIMDEGKKNGFVGEMAAKEAVKQLQKNASLKADDILEEANKVADELLKNARIKADKLNEEAQKKADKLK